MLNGNIYYVFNGDGKTDTTNYYFVPVLAKDAGAVKYSYKKLASTLMQTLEPSIDTYDPIATQSTYEGLVRSGLIAKYMRNYMSADTQPREVSVDYNTGCYTVGTHPNIQTQRRTNQLVYKNGEQVVDQPYYKTSPFGCPPNIEPYKLK